MSDLIVEGANVLDVETGTYAERTVAIIAGRFTDDLEPRNRDTTVLQAHGSYLLPGLIDCHVHVTAAEADLSQLRTWPRSYLALRTASTMAAMLQRGFTTVRDLGGADHGLARAQREGYLLGPRLAFCGRPLSQTGGHGDDREPGDDQCWTTGMSQVVDGVDDLRRAARNELRRGAHHLKVMASGGVASPTDRISSTQYSVEELEAVVQEAGAAERYVAAHAYTARSIERALNAGVRSIEHGNLIDQERIDLLNHRGAFLVMNLVAYEVIRTEGRAQGMPEDMVQKVDEVLEGGYRALEMAAASGTKLCYGSDLLGGLQVHQSGEFAIRGRLQPALDVIRSATTTAAELLQQPGEIGTLRSGALGDLILVAGDPVDDVSILSRPDQITHVVQGGRLVKAPSGLTR